jgi:hypothetical protein
MAIIKGITVTLYVKKVTEKDKFNHELTSSEPVEVHNVLVAPVSSSDTATSTEADRRKCVYQLAIPKSDDHDWNNVDVEFFGHKWHTVGMPIQGIDRNIPLDWNKKVTVERYE